MNWETLVSEVELAPMLGREDLRIVDARFVLMNQDPAAGYIGYQASHLPGAVYAHLNNDLCDLSRAGHGRHPLPEALAFAETLGRWGISPAHQVVVYDAGDGSMAAARLWWLLKLMGHKRVAVLDGGLVAWRDAALPETSLLPSIDVLPVYPGEFEESQVVSAEEIMSRLSEARGWLLDARAAERFRGEVEPLDSAAGHVPGAVNCPYMQNLDAGRFRSVQVLRAEIEPLLIGHTPDEVVVMCGSGVTACHLLLAMEHAGLKGARVYAGSWSGWISDASRPIAQGSP